MPNAGDLGNLRCAGCGAPFEATGANRCVFCGNLLRRTTTARAPVALPPPPAPPVARRLFVVYGVMAAIGVAITGIASVASNRRASTTITPAPGSFSPRGLGASRAEGRSNGIGDALIALPRTGGGYDLLTSFVNPSHTLGLFDGKSHELRWRSGTFARVVDRSTTVVDDHNAYVVDDPRVTAIRLSDGATLWQASLATGFPSGCEGCLRAMKDRVLALQKDGTLQAFDVADGQVVWSSKLSNMPSRLPLAGAWLVVSRRAEGRNNRVTLDFIDPGDGTVVHSVQPSCINKAFHQPEYTDNRSPLFFDPDGRTVYAMFGFFSHCAQAWDVETGKRRWSTYLSSWSSNTKAFLGEQAIWYPDGGALVAIDKTTGAVRRLPIEKDYRAEPLFTTGGTLIAKAAPDWDSNRVVLWGLDPTDGKRRWQFQLSAYRLSLHDFFGTWFAQPTAAGLVLLQQVDDEHLSVETLNLTTGVSAGRRVLTTGRSGRRPLLRDDLGWIAVQGGLDAVSFPGGQVAYHLR